MIMFSALYLALRKWYEHSIEVGVTFYNVVSRKKSLYPRDTIVGCHVP